MATYKDDVSSAASDAHSEREIPSPWSRAVRGGSGDIVSPEERFDLSSPRPLSVDCNSSIGQQDSDGGKNATRAKKSPWSAPSNGSADMKPVMGAESWPALSEATKNVVKPSSESVRAISVPAAASISQKPSVNNPNSSSPTNYSRQKTKRIGSNGSELSNGKPAQLSSTTESSTREFINRSNNDVDHGSRSGVPSSQMQGVNDPHRIHGISKRGNGGQQHGFSNRRDQGSSTYEWNPRSFAGARDSHLQHRQQPRNITRAFIQPPPPPPALVSPAFIPPHITNLGSPIGYHEITSPVFYVPTSPHDTMRGMPFVSPPVYFAAPDPHLQIMLAKQIEYYFSPENLCNDSYLRQNMDEEGWVSVSLIANFNRVKFLTTNIQFILDTVRPSSLVEVQGDKIRKRNDWMNWLPAHKNENISPRMGNTGTQRSDANSSDSTDTTKNEVREALI